MNAAEMKAKCLAEATDEYNKTRLTGTAVIVKRVADAIAAIPVEPERNLQEEMMDCYQFGAVPKADPRDAQIAMLRAALQCLWHETVQSGNSEAIDYNWPTARRLTLAALAATKPKGDMK